MGQLTILPLDPPTGRHARREQALADAWSADELAGRTVWCSTSMPVLRGAAVTLQEQLCRSGVDADALDDNGDIALIGATVAADDVVVLSDLGAVQLALAAREHGAHVVWHVDARFARRRPALDRFVQATDHCADAYVLSWSQAVGPGRHVERVMAVLPHADVAAAVQIPARAPAARRTLAWSCALAEGVHADRTEHVGGVVQARPCVAVR